MVLLRQILFDLAIAAIAQAILTPIFAKQVPFLERVALSTIDSNTDENGHV